MALDGEQGVEQFADIRKSRLGVFGHCVGDHSQQWMARTFTGQRAAQRSRDLLGMGQQQFIGVLGRERWFSEPRVEQQTTQRVFDRSARRRSGREW